jgi:predicted PurR-regulated permease PerM
MQRLTWRKIFIIMLLLTILIGLSGCQAAKNLDSFTHEISTIPDRIGQALVNLLGSISDIGSALASQVGNIVKNFTGR